MVFTVYGIAHDAGLYFLSNSRIISVIVIYILLDIGKLLLTDCTFCGTVMSSKAFLL